MNDATLQLNSPTPPATAIPPDEIRHLQELWQRFDAIVGPTGDFFTLIDAGGVYRAVNTAYCEAHGRSRDELLGRTVAEIWGAQVYESALREPLQRCLGGAEVHYRARFEFPRTGPRHYEVTLYPYSIDGHQPSHVIAVTRDVTAPHHAGEQVRLVLQLAQAINQANDFNAALTLTLRHVCQFTGWTLGLAWCPSTDGEFLDCLPPGDTGDARFAPFCAASQKHRWRRGEGLPGMVWSSKQPEWVPAFSGDPRFLRAALAAQIGLKGAMAIPVIAADEVVAVLEFLLTNPRSDDERLMGVVTATAEQLGSHFLRKRTEVALRDSEARYRAIIETANDVIFFLSADGRIASLNHAFETLTGWPRARWLGQPFAPLLHPEDLPVALGRFQAILQGDTPHRSEYRVLKAGGDYAVGEFTLSRQSNDGRTTGLFGIGRDITERKRAEEQLDRFFNRSLDMHCLAGFDGFLKRVNPAWEKTLGYDTRELLNRPYLELVHPEDRPAVVRELARLQHGEDITAFEMRCHCKDGTVKWTLWNATPLSSQELIIATGRDITERKRTEEAVLQSEEHYRELFHQAFQMQENLRRLSARIIEVQEQERKRISRDLHDEVGQALTAINVNLAVIRNALAAAPPAVVHRIADTQQLLEQTMETVHGFARELRPAMLDELGLLPALRSYIKGFTERTGLAVQFQAEQKDGIERLDAERKTVLYRVVQEGLNNIAKHARARQVTVHVTESGHRVHLEIKDDGRGFATNGQSADSAPKRLGLLGMAERVRLVSGEFSIESRPKQGTALQVSIPVKAT